MSNDRARELRKTMSDAERTLWREVRGGQIAGFRFRRQHPIGPYVADFVCLEKRLVIEVDGSQHAEPGAMAHDARRTAWLEREGFQVLRFWTRDLSGNMSGVLDEIWKALQDLPEGRGRSPPPRRTKNDLGRV